MEASRKVNDWDIQLLDGNDQGRRIYRCRCDVVIVHGITLNEDRAGTVRAQEVFEDIRLCHELLPILFLKRHQGGRAQDSC